MTSRLHYPRLFLAVATAFIAWLFYTYWPNSPEWQLDNQTLLGCDTASQTIYSASSTILNARDLNSLQVNAWNLQTAQPIRSTHFLLPSLDAGSPYYRFLLSPDASLLAVYANNKPFVQLLRMADAKPVEEVIYVDDPLDTLGFSPDGRWLALNTRYYIRVWDTRTLKVIFDHKLDMPRLGAEQVWNTSTKSNRVHFSSDVRYLAVANSMHVQVFDLAQRKLLGITDVTGQPRFHENGQTLTVMSFTGLPAISNFRLNDNGINRIPQTSSQAANKEIHADLGDSQYATIQQGPTPWSPPRWLPAFVSKSWENWNHHRGRQHQIRLRNLITCEIDSELSIPLHHQLGFTIDSGRPPGQAIKFLEQQNLVLIEDNGNLLAWNTISHHNTTFWLTESFLICLTFFFLYKTLVQKMKPPLTKTALS